MSVEEQRVVLALSPWPVELDSWEQKERQEALSDRLEHLTGPFVHDEKGNPRIWFGS